jgi:hypothetical protein
LESILVFDAPFETAHLWRRETSWRARSSREHFMNPQGQMKRKFVKDA